MPHYEYETRWLMVNTGAIAGVDEAGRGPLAGPVFAGAVILDRSCIPEGIDDSKKLNQSARESLYARLMECAIAGIGEASVEEIDRINIRRATHLAMARAVKALRFAPAFALVDGNDAPALPCPCDTIIDGDALSLSIAAASIIAKVARDLRMRELDAEFPGYGWHSNKGYGTKDHVKALNKLGPSPHHRRSFAPVQRMGDFPLTANIRDP
jgi:ribonuclease HII